MSYCSAVLTSQGTTHMHNKLLLASVGAIALSGSAALAAEPLPPPTPPPFTWTGPYVGGQIGYAWAAHGSFDDFGFDPRSRIFFTDVFSGPRPMACSAAPMSVPNISTIGWSWASKARSTEQA